MDGKEGVAGSSPALGFLSRPDGGSGGTLVATIAALAAQIMGAGRPAPMIQRRYGGAGDGGADGCDERVCGNRCDRERGEHRDEQQQAASGEVLHELVSLSPAKAGSCPSRCARVGGTSRCSRKQIACSLSASESSFSA